MKEFFNNHRSEILDDFRDIFGAMLVLVSSVGCAFWAPGIIRAIGIATATFGLVGVPGLAKRVMRRRKWYKEHPTLVKYFQW